MYCRSTVTLHNCICVNVEWDRFVAVICPFQGLDEINGSQDLVIITLSNGRGSRGIPQWAPCGGLGNCCPRIFCPLQLSDPHHNHFLWTKWQFTTFGFIFFFRLWKLVLLDVGFFFPFHVFGDLKGHRISRIWKVRVQGIQRKVIHEQEEENIL